MSKFFIRRPIVAVVIAILTVIIGVVVCLLGLGLIFDAWTPDDIIVKRERRRRPRVERSRSGALQRHGHCDRNDS